MNTLTADTVTDEQIREYTREHWRDPWMGGGAGKGTVNDAAIIALATSHPDLTRHTRAQFAALINLANARKEPCGFGIDGAGCYACETFNGVRR